MAKRKITPERREKRKELLALLQEAGIDDVAGVEDLFKEMVGTVLEGGLEGELDEELGYSKYDYRNKDTDNSRNGHSEKTLRSSYGDVELSVPRDRKGAFEPQIVKKHQTSLTQDIEEKILSMYAKGMSTTDIESHIREIYGLPVSDSTISRITDKILPVVREWQQRPLESVYAVVLMDAVHFNVRSEGRIIKKAVYVAIGIKMDGIRDVLGMRVGENESAKYWINVLNGLRNRGVQDIVITCIDGFTGFPEAEIQHCIIHQIRNTTRFVSYKDVKKLIADLKLVYAAVDEETALYQLNCFGEKWDDKYSQITKSWRTKWATLSTYFKYPQEVRTLISTTNAIENFNRQLRKVSKSKSVFPTDDRLLKMLYLAMMDISKKWTGRRRDWGIIHSQLLIYFEDRLDGLDISCLLSDLKYYSIFVGKNGTGKSTLIEAVAVAFGGGSRNFSFNTRETHSELYRHIALSRLRYPKDGYFLRAESLYNIATNINELDAGSGGNRIIDSYGRVSLHRQSYGKVFSP